MSAQDNLSSALFHGTIETLKPGDVIGQNRVAFATGNMDYALKHTSERVRSGLGDKPGGEYPVHHGNVYTVEPLGATESDPDSELGATNVRTTGGLRVTGHVASVLGPEDDRRVIKNRFTKFDPTKESYVKNGRNRFSD